MKDRLFLDTNIILDLLGERRPYYDSIAKVASLADRNEIHLVISAISYTTLYYLLSKFERPAVVKEKLRKLTIISSIAGVDANSVEKSLNSEFRDFEDSVQYYGALSSNCNIIITRNGKDYKSSDLPVMTPDEYLVRINRS